VITLVRHSHAERPLPRRPPGCDPGGISDLLA
jgi:hypothetical protein